MLAGILLPEETLASSVRGAAMALSVARPVYARGLEADPRWEEKASVSESHPGLEGNELQTAVFTDYLEDPANPNKRSLLFSKKGMQLFRRHILNDRN